MPDKDVNINLRVKKADDAKRKLDGVAASSEKVGQKTEQAGRKAQSGGEKIGGMGDKAHAAKQKTGALATALGGLTAGVSAIIALAAAFIQFLKDWLSHITQINTAQKELVESTRALDQASKALASQANIMGTKEGMEGSREDVLSITKTGNTTIAMGGDVGVATHSAFGTSGERLTPAQREIAGVVAGFAKRKDLSAAEAGQLVKLLSAMGVKTAGEAKQRIQQLSTVQQASQEQTFGGFIGGATKAMVPRLAAGGSVEGALSSYAKGLDIDAGDPAAEKMKQMAAHLQNEKILQAMGKEYGVSELDIRNMPFDEQIDMFSGWVSKHAATGAGQQYLLKSGLSGEQLNVAKTLYTKDMLQRRAMFKGLAGGATAGQFDVGAEGYAKTVQGQIDAQESLRERTAASASPEARFGLAVIRVAEADFARMMAEGEVPWDIAPNPLIPNEVEREAYMMYQLWYNPMWDRLSKLPKDDKYRAIRKRLKLPHAGPSPHMRYLPSPQEVGELEFMMRDAEAGAGQSVIHNDYSQHYDHSVNLNPVAGNAEERLIGPRWDPDW